MNETDLSLDFWFWIWWIFLLVLHVVANYFLLLVICIWSIFMIGLHAVLAGRFKRSKWKWGIIGLFLGIFSFIWLLVLGENKEESV